MVKRIINKFSFHSLKGTMKWKKSYERGKWKLRSNKYETLWLHACFSTAAIDVIIFAFFTPHYHHHLHYIIYYEISHLIFITNQVFFVAETWMKSSFMADDERVYYFDNELDELKDARGVLLMLFFLCIINSSSCIHNEYDSWKYYVESLMKKIKYFWHVNVIMWMFMG